MVRKATKEDFNEILNIYESARQYMKTTGNPEQWGDELPLASTTASDIENGTLYVVEREGQLCGVMEFHIGEDPFYSNLHDASWNYEGDYATIHRLASNGKHSGIFSEFLEFGKGICPHIKIDTHLDNVIMQNLIEKNGFKKCGVFFSTPDRGWIVYEKVFD